MAEIVALLLLVDVVEDDDGGDEVDHLAGGQQVQVGAAVASSVAVTAVRVRFLFLFFLSFLRRFGAPVKESYPHRVSHQVFIG